jgi:SAM-dependent methyltransferase
MPQNGTVVWEHRLGHGIPDRAAYADGSVDEVRLRGSWNVPISEQEGKHLLAEARRVLRPGGRLFMHVLTAERPVSGDLDLPGPAAAVRHVPLDKDMFGLPAAAGFENVQLLKFDAKPCFVRQGVAMRETQIEAWKPSPRNGATATVLYKGPFGQVVDDAGNVYARGQRVVADAATAERFRAPEWAGQFLVQSGEAENGR